MAESEPIVRARHYRLLWAVAIVSLLLNLALISGLLVVRARAGRQVAQAAQRLGAVEITNFELPVHIDQMLAISLTVPFSDTFAVPIEATVPLSLSVPFNEAIDVPINTTIPINTTFNVPVDVPVVGRVAIPLPIVTNIPISLTVVVPISRTIVVQEDIAINLTVDIPIQTAIPIETEVPILLDFPVTVPLRESALQLLITEVRQALTDLARSLGATVPAGD